MTEFEIIQYIENHISVHGNAGLTITWLYKPMLPTLEPMIRDMPALGLRFVMTPDAYTIGDVSHQKGESVAISTMQDILDLLESRRKEMGYGKTKDIATLLAMDSTYYSHLENGKYRMSLKMLLRICRMMWIDVRVEPIDNPDSR